MEFTSSSVLTACINCLIFLFVLVCETDAECIVSARETPAQSVKKCKQLERVFLKDLSRSSKERATCNKYYAFRDCFIVLHKKCPELVTPMEKKWTKIIHDYECHCTQNSACEKDLKCVKEQLTGKLADGCDDMLDFNLEQREYNRHQQCFFLKENIHCKEALVSSACGTTMGHLTYIVAKHEQRKKLHAARCHVPHVAESTYNGFRYDGDRCPADLIEKAEECRHQHIEGDNRLSFMKANDLVMNTQEILGNACNKYAMYKRCISRLERRCPEGMAAFRDHSLDLRTYTLKMEYICHTDNRQDYEHSADCYADAQRAKKPSVCVNLWASKIPELKKSVSAVKFFCHPEHNDVIRLKETLAEVKGCYETVFMENCGQRAGLLMGGLVSRAFEDPYYLRFDFLPNCALHSTSLQPTTTTTTTTTTTPTTTPRPVRHHHRHSTPRPSDSEEHRPTSRRNHHQEDFHAPTKRVFPTPIPTKKSETEKHGGKSENNVIKRELALHNAALTSSASQHYHHLVDTTFIVMVSLAVTLFCAYTNVLR